MAAWSDHEDEHWERVTCSPQKPRKVSTPDATTLHPCPTCNTAMSGECSQCASAVEPFPLEVWTFFSDEDLDQLVVDACAEMGRRAVARGVDTNA